MTYRINLPLIKAIGFILKDEIQYGIRILQIICQGIRAGAAPASAVVEGHHMESCPAQRLRQIEILLAARNPVEQEYHRVRPCACGGIECGQDPSPPAVNQDPDGIRAKCPLFVMRFTAFYQMVHACAVSFLRQISACSRSSCWFRLFLYQSLP